MVMVIMHPDLFELRRRAATVRRLAAGRLKLDRRVMDMKALAQTAVDLGEDRGTLRGRHLRDRYMAG